MNIYDEKKVITHEAIRLIAKEKLHWSGGRIEVLRYVDEQQAKEERAKKVEELLGLYRENFSIEDAYPKDKIKMKQLEEKLK